MASFTETATLTVVDNASAQIKTINAALKSLIRTSKKLSDVSAKIDIKTTGLAQANKMIGKALQDMHDLQSKAANIKMKVDKAQALRDLAEVRRAAGGRGGRGGGTGSVTDDDIPRRRRRRPTAADYAHSATQGVSTGLGLGIPLGGHPALMALEVAAFGAAKALKYVASATMERDRVNLLANVGATPEQRAVIDAEIADRTKDRGPLPLSETDRKKQITQLLGNVAGPTGAARAQAAVKVSDYIEREMLPLQYALNPEKSFKEVQEGTRTLMKGVDLVSTSLVNAADVYDQHGKRIGLRGEISAEGKRALTGLQLARVAEPDLPANLVKSVSANLKSAAQTLSPEAYAKVLISANVRGVRAANELYRAQTVLGGTVDVKKVNEALAQMGLIEGYTREGRKQTVKAGSGRAKDAELLLRDPYTWINTYLRERMDKELTAQQTKLGKTYDPAKDQELQVEWVKRRFAGSSAAAITGITDALTGDAQARQTIANASDAIKKNNLPDALKKSLSANLQNVQTALSDRAAALGESAAKAAGIPEMMAQLAVAIKDPTSLAARELLTKGMDSVFKILDMSPLEAAAKALTGSSVDLTAAAFKLMGLPEPARTPAEQTSRDVKTIDEQRAAIVRSERETTDAQAYLDRYGDKGPKSAQAKQQIENAKRVIAEANKKIAELEAAITRRTGEQLAKDTEATSAVADYDLAVNAYAADEKTRIEAEKKVMADRQAAAKKQVAAYKRELARRRKLTPAQREKEDAAFRAKETGTVPYGPEAPGAEKQPTPLPPVQPLEDASNKLIKASENNNTAADKMAAAVTGVDAASNNFAAAFDTGAQKLATAGQTAVSDMQAGAGGIGAAIAAAFVAGASGVRVGVDVSGITQAKADTGALNRPKTVTA